MFVAHRAMEQRVLAALHEAGFGDATVAQGRVFARIAERGRAAQAVAAVAEREVEAQWEAHLGIRDMARLRTLMGRLREATDPYRDLDPD